MRDLLSQVINKDLTTADSTSLLKDLRTIFEDLDCGNYATPEEKLQDALEEIQFQLNNYNEFGEVK